MIVGYCRTSTLDQQAGLDAQIRDLEAAGSTKIFQEQVSSVAPRAQLEAALDYLRDGDVFVVTKLDRLARSIRDLTAIIDMIAARGASLRILALNLDTSTPTGKLMLTVLGGVAEWERSVMLERQREGVSAARAAGRYTGRKPTQRARRGEIEALVANGIGPAEIARQLGMARSSVYRILDGG